MHLKLILYLTLNLFLCHAFFASVDTIASNAQIATAGAARAGAAAGVSGSGTPSGTLLRAVRWTQPCVDGQILRVRRRPKQRVQAHVLRQQGVKVRDLVVGHHGRVDQRVARAWHQRRMESKVGRPELRWWEARVGQLVRQGQAKREFRHS